MVFGDSCETSLTEIPNKVDHTVFLYTEYESEHTKPYIAIFGCKVSAFDEIPEGMTGKSLDKSIYVKTYAKVDLMQGLWTFGQRFWTKYIPQTLKTFGEKAQICPMKK